MFNGLLTETMRTAGLVLLAVVAVSADGYPRVVVPNSPDLTIKTRTVFPRGPVSTVTVRLKGARQRIERTYDGSRQPASYISHCDLRRTLVLNHEARTYGYIPIEDGSRFREHPAPVPEREENEDAGKEVITIDAADTGERRRLAGLTARHIITTMTRELPGIPSSATSQIKDGWYVDLPPSGCVDWGGSGTMLVSRLVSGGKSLAAPRVTYLRRAEGGFPIIETDRTTTREGSMTVTTELVEASDRPIDAAVFEVPDGYRPGLPLWQGGFDLNRPDTLVNRVRLVWEEVTGLVSRFWH